MTATTPRIRTRAAQHIGRFRVISQAAVVVAVVVIVVIVVVTVVAVVDVVIYHLFCCAETVEGHN